MGTVNIGISHDNNPMVTEFRHIEIILAQYLFPWP